MALVIETDRYPHITSDPSVQGGAPVIRGTRIPIRAIAFYWRETGDRRRILDNYPTLSPEMLDEAIRFYEQHRDAIDEELKDEASTA